MKACRNLGLETQKMQMIAETVVAALRKGNEGCFTFGNKNHLKRDCSKKAKKYIYIKIKKPPKICPRCCRGLHWAQDCKSKFDIKGKRIPRNSKQGTHPGPLQQKPGANSIFYLKPSTSGSAAVDIPDLFLDNMKLMSSI